MRRCWPTLDPMDATEVCRQRAARLHADLLSLGAEPWAPYSLAVQEATRRDLDVELVAKGDVRLRGGRALYDPDALLILHEDCGDPFTHAFLVAHEIGHAEFGGHTEVVLTTEIDPERAMEAAPVGVDRVVDYGRHERQEVRMDLFARELLLPRPVARRLHLDEHMSASEIAHRLGAPLAVIQQQLLDALLLPSVELRAGAAPQNRPLNDDQKQAVRHRGVPYILEAGPGTGKTQTLVARVDSLLDDGVDPARILVLTFSNKAAGELSERIAVKRPDAAGSMWIGTFHAFGLDLIRRFYDRLCLPSDPKLLDRVDAISSLSDEFPRLGLKHFKDLWDPVRVLADILSAISRASDEVVNAAGYRVLAEAMRAAAGADDKKREAAEKCLEVAEVFAVYERIKQQQGKIDFGDLVALPVRLCERDPEVRAYLATLYEHVLVDEYQDVNRASVRLLEAVTNRGHNLWVVGDAKQAIYRFRGASSFNVARFGMTDFPNGIRGRLTINYRSGEEIVNAFVAFAKKGMRVAVGTSPDLKADRGSLGTQPEYRSTFQADDEIAIVSEAIEELRGLGVPYKDQALLCSGNDRLGKFAGGLESLGIPVLFLGSLFERDEIKDLLSLASILIDRRAMGLVRVATMPQFSMSLGDVSATLRHLRAADGKPLEWLDSLNDIEGLSAGGLTALFRLRDLLAGFAPETSPWALLATVLLEGTRMAADIASATTVQARSRGIAIWQFMNFLRAQPREAGLPIHRLISRIRTLALLSDDRDLRQLPAAAQGIDAVRLMTMHASKGLEFPVVHIPSLNADTLPRSPNMMRGVAPPDGLIEGATGSGFEAMATASKEEQECLFFVALSRARNRLLLYSPTQKSNSAARKASPFLDLLGRIDRRFVTPTKKLPSGPASAPIDVHFDADISITDRQLGLYERCARRYFYTHILEVGGRRSETAFMQMHGAVQSVIDELCVNPLNVTSREMRELFDTAWLAKGPHDHGYSEEFRGIAERLVGFFSTSQSGFSQRPVEPLRLRVKGAEIVIRPDVILESASGGVVMRRVHTGHRRSSDGDSLASAVFRLAADEHSPGCTVELVHLGDESVTPLSMTKTVLANRREKVLEMFDNVRTGLFPTNEGRSCPSCPSFFICAQVPAGRLVSKSC